MRRTPFAETARNSNEPINKNYYITNRPDSDSESSVSTNENTLTVKNQMLLPVTAMSSISSPFSGKVSPKRVLHHNNLHNQ